MSRIKLLQNLKLNLVKFFDNMIELFPSEGSFVLARLYFNDQAPMEDMMQYIILHLLPYSTEIQNKNESFFLDENNQILKKINPKSVNQFKLLWTELDAENKEIVWKYFGSFILLAKRYQETP